MLWLPSSLKLFKHRHPWQRTYKRNKFAQWETNQNYCDKVINYIFLLTNYQVCDHEFFPTGHWSSKV